MLKDCSVIWGTPRIFPEIRGSRFGPITCCPIRPWILPWSGICSAPASGCSPRWTRDSTPGWPASDQVISPADISQNFLPRYFYTSGKTGAFAAEDPNIAIEAFIGEPHLIRILNAGIQTHSPHIHANHVYVTAVNRVVQKNVVNIDTFTVGPTDTVDWLLPLHPAAGHPRPRHSLAEPDPPGTGPD